jgi:hypothetical protein
MNNRHRHSIVLIAALACLLLASCTSKKKLVSPMAHAANYEWMTAKMQVSIENETVSDPNASVVDLTGAIRMKRDSTIWISASALMGIETVRACITPDSVVVLNRFEKTYLAEPLQEVAERLNLPMTLKESQSLLLGNGSSDHVELHYGPYRAKIRYSDIQWDEPTTFPMTINKNYERMKL